MKNSTMNTIYAALTNVDFENKAEIMAEIEKELNRGAAEKATKIAEYEKAWPIVKEAMRMIGNAATIADIFAEAENRLEGFSKNRISYGMTHYWGDRVVKTEGKVNLYSLK